MSDSLRGIFKIPKDVRERMIQGTKEAKAFLDNAETLKKLGLLNEQDESDMKSLIQMSERIERITSSALEEGEEEE